MYLERSRRFRLFFFLFWFLLARRRFGGWSRGASAGGALAREHALLFRWLENLKRKVEESKEGTTEGKRKRRGEKERFTRTAGKGLKQ